MSRIPELVRTPRLTGERPEPRHASELAPVLAQPEVAAWLWPGALGGPRTPEQAAELVTADAAAWERDGWGPWVVRDRRDGTVVGRAGLARTVIEGEPVVELAWLLSAERWGQGLASEIAREAVRAAFEHLGLEELVAVTLVGNHASRGVMRRLGMEEERELEHAGLPHVLARLRRGR